jgi:hypothetical protein
MNKSARIQAAIECIEPRVLLSAFQPGDLVVYRVGSGSAALSSASTAVYLDEYTRSGTLVQSIALPSATSGSNNPLTASGTGANEGILTLSQNGQNLLLTGYDAAPGVTSIASTQTTDSGFITRATAATPIVITTGSTAGMTNGDPITINGVGGISGANGSYFLKVVNSTSFSLYTSAALTTGVTGTGTYTSNTGTWTDPNITTGFVQREVGVVSSSGSINTSTTLGTAFPGTSIYSAASVDGTSGLYASGGNDAVYTTLGSASTPTSLLSQGGTSGGAYAVEVVNGQLYASTNASATVLSSVGTGLPTTAGQTATELPGVAFSGTSGAGVGYSREFAFATLNGGSAPDTLYVADNYNDGIDKLSLVNGSWVLNGEIGAYGSDGNVLAGVTGVVAEPVAGGEQLFISTANKIFTITDPYGYNSAGGTAGTQGGGVFSGNPPLTTLLSPATNEAFRGIQFVPQPAGGPAIATQPTNQTAVVGTNATFNATAFGTNVGVQWQVSTNGGASYTPISGATFTTLTVPATAAENGYEYEAVFTNGSGSVTSSPAMLTVIPGPAFDFSASTFTTPNTDGQTTITVNRFGDSSVQDTVQYATSNGTAVAGTNYTATSGTLTFPAGATSETFGVPVKYIASQNSGLTFNVSLSNVVGSNSSNAVLGSPSVVTINPPLESIGLSSATSTVNDTDGTDVFSVVRGGTYASDAGTVPYTITGSVSASGTANFAAGQSVSTVSVALPTATTSNQPFTITLGTGLTGFTSGGAILGTTTTSTVTDVHAAATNLSGSAASVTDIETSGPYPQSYAPVVGDLTAGTGSFAYLAYEVLEFSQATSPSLYPALGTTVNANGISALSLQLFNTDASGTDNYSGHIGNFNVYFLPDTDATTATSKLTFSTSSAPTGLASSQFKTAPVLIGTFSFNNTAGYDTYTPVAVPALVNTAMVADLNAGSNFRLAVTPETYGTGAIATDWRGYFSGQTPVLSLAATQTVNQTPEYMAFQSSSYSVNETAGTATITLTRTGSNISDTASVNYATSNGTAVAGTNYTAETGTATFAAGSATTTFTVPVTNVANQGGDKVLNLSLSTPTTGSPGTTIGGLGSPTTATLTIVDSSTAPTETLTSTIVDASDIEAGGPYTDVEIKATDVSGDYPSYGAVDFTASAPMNPVTGIDSITMTLTNEGTVSAGPVDFYLVSDNTSNILPASPQAPNPHFYDSTQGIEGIGSQFGTALLLGSYNLTDTTGGDVVTVPLANYTPATESALINYLNASSSPSNVFRIVVTPENGTVDANWVASSAAISIKVQEGTPSTLPAWLASNSAATWNSTTHTLTVTGAATIIADPGSDEPMIVASGSAAQLAITPAIADVDIHVGGITLSNGAGIDVTQADAPTSGDLANGEFVASNHHSSHNTLVIGVLGASSDPSFSVDASSTLNLEDNDLIVHTGGNDPNGYNALAAVQGLVKTGRNSGAWNGNGLTSTVARSQDNSDGEESVQLAVVDNTDLGSPFHAWQVGNSSETLGSNDIIVKYTYTGDFNLDGKVDANDVNIQGLNYDGGASTGNEWAFGDTNDDGVLNANDINTLGLYFGNGTANGNDTYQL